MKFLNLIKKLQKGSFHLGLLVVGIGFLLFTLLPLLSPNWTSDGSVLTNVITGVIGIGCIVISVIGLRNVLGTSLEEANDFNKVNKAEIDPAEVQRIRNNNEPVKDYYFHFCGHLNQSYILETTDREPAFEFVCDKMGLVNDFIFTFRNHLTGEERTCKVSHTKTSSYGSEDFSLVDKSYFEIDGRNVFEIIGEKGYSFEPYLDPVVFSFKIRHYGVEVADLKCAGTNVLPEYEGKEGLRDVAMTNGLYRVSCKDEDVEAVALIAFTVSRIEII